MPTLTMILTLLSSTASAGGGAGITFDAGYLPRYGSPEASHDAPGGVGCVGFAAHSFTDQGWRFGGEGQWCRGDNGVRLNQGGGQFGYRRGGRLWWTTTMGLGIGTLNDPSGDERYRALYGYLRPTVGVGVSLGGLAIEVGPYANLPLNLVQWVGGPEDARGLVTPHGGLMASFMLGKWKPKPPPPIETRSPPPAPAPVMPQPPPPSRPLAIPGE